MLIMMIRLMGYINRSWSSKTKFLMLTILRFFNLNYKQLKISLAIFVISKEKIKENYSMFRT